MSIAARRQGRAITDRPNLPAQRGALPIGTASYAIPGGALFVDPVNGSNANSGTIGSPFATVAYAATQVGTNGTIVCRTGTYHEQFDFTSGRQPCTIMNYPGETVWFDGSIVVTSWTQNGSVWTHTGVPTQFDHSTSAGWASYSNFLNGDMYAGLSDQVFYDGEPLTQIADATTPAAGQFSVDYSANTITIGSDPSGHEVRVSDLRYLVVASQQLSWKGVGIRRYAPDNTNSVSAPFYYGGNSGGSLFENVIVRQSAIAGANLNKPNITVRYCTFENNMHSGLGGTRCDNLLVDSCVMQNNNQGKFNPQPTTAGIKVTRCLGATVRNCYIVDNVNAMGVWMDVSCVEIEVLHNYIAGAHYKGIEQELSDGGNIGGVQHRSIVAGNYIIGANFGISCLDTGHADFYNNTILSCTSADIMMQRDNRPLNTGNDTFTLAECPWDVTYNVSANNIMGPCTIPIRVFDSNNNRSADDMYNEIRNNTFTKLSGGIVQWGNASNSYTTYNTPAALEAAVPALTSGNVQSSSIDHSKALPVPANVAAALGVSPGAKRMGAYISS
jgi:hypothetical protein